MIFYILCCVRFCVTLFPFVTWLQDVWKEAFCTLSASYIFTSFRFDTREASVLTRYIFCNLDFHSQSRIYRLELVCLRSILFSIYSDRVGAVVVWPVEWFEIVDFRILLLQIQRFCETSRYYLPMLVNKLLILKRIGSNISFSSSWEDIKFKLESSFLFYCLSRNLINRQQKILLWEILHFHHEKCDTNSSCNSLSLNFYISEASLPFVCSSSRILL